MMSSSRVRSRSPAQSAFAEFRFPPDVIMVAVRWYPQFNLFYRDVEELLVERGIQVNHVTVYRWVQRFTPQLADAARFALPLPKSSTQQVGAAAWTVGILTAVDWVGTAARAVAAAA